MDDEFELQAFHPGALSAEERQRFEALVIEGGEVAGITLSTNIGNARIVVLVRKHGVIRGVGALKRPQASYREKVSKKAGVALPLPDYPYELGYIYFERSLRGHRLSHRLVAKALDEDDGAGVFATVRSDNAVMRATLEKAGFAPAGDLYPGSKDGTVIGVLLRPPSSRQNR